MIEQLFKEKIKVQNEDVNEIIFSQYFLNCYQIVFIKLNGLRDSWFPENCEPRS